MINGLRVLAVITARGGSKGVVGKNLRPIGGRPLIGWTIDEAAKSKYIDRTILTSDDDAIIDFALAEGCEAPFVRPDHLATDEATSLDVVRHALDEEGAGFDLLVLLQPTSPFRTARDIDAAVDKMLAEDARTCISVCEVSKSPHWMFEIKDGERLTPVLKVEDVPRNTRRQDLPPVYIVNGAVYVAYIADLLGDGNFIDDDTVGYIMPVDRSLDIDHELDLKVAELMLAEG